MSYNMFFEMDQALLESDIRHALVCVGARDLIEANRGFAGFDGWFPRTEMDFTYFREQKQHPIFSEGGEDKAFLVTSRLCLSLQIARHKACMDELFRLVKHLTEHSSGQFVLSYELEDVYARKVGQELWLLPRFITLASAGAAERMGTGEKPEAG